MAKLAAALRDRQPTPSAVRPPSLANRQLSVRSGIVLDSPPIDRDFGDVLVQPAAAYHRGEQVRSDFVTGHPGNNLRSEGTYLEVQRSDGGQWRTVATDSEKGRR